ncbi:MAG: tetratricopeptide repeat protein [Cytophagales bacterium]|nr:tetratricopeptide repeat protein [Cytophagales bacterium]
MITRIAAIFLFLLSCSSSFAQIDSLLVLIEQEQEDSSKFMLKYQLGKEYYFSNKYQQANQVFEEVLAYFSSVSDSSSMVSNHIWISICSEYVGNFEKAISHGDIAYRLARQLGDVESAAMALNNLGITYKQLGRNAEALAIYEIGLGYSKEISDTDYEAAFLENMGIVYSNLGHFVEALKSNLAALKIYESQGDEQSVAELQLNIGLLYKRNKEYQKAVDHYKKAIDIEIKTKDSLGLQIAYVNSGNAYLEWGKLEEAKKCLLKGKAISEGVEVRCTRLVGIYLGNLYLQLSQLDSAEYYLEKDMKTLETCDFTRLNSMASFLMGKLRFQQGYFYESVNFYKQSLKESKLTDYLSVQKDAALALYEYYKKMGDSQKALQYHETYLTAHDSLFNQENTRQLTWLEANAQMERVSDSLKYINEQETRFFNLELKQQKSRTNMILILAGVVFVSLLLFYLYLRNRQQLLYQVEISKERQKGFKAVITAEEAERSRIAKDLHDGVVQHLAAIKLVLAQALPKLNEETETILKAQRLAEQAADDTRTISHQMMPKALMEAGIVPAMKDVINNQLTLNQITVEFQHFGLKERYPQQVEVTIYRIFQELSNNIVKHAQAKHVDVQLMEHGGKLIFIVEDDGIGIGDSKGSGIGLNNISSRILTVDGKVDFSSGESSGTVVTMVIPL